MKSTRKNTMKTEKIFLMGFSGIEMVKARYLLMKKASQIMVVGSNIMKAIMDNKDISILSNPSLFQK
jgi:hypothetical protein